MNESSEYRVQSSELYSRMLGCRPFNHRLSNLYSALCALFFLLLKRLFRLHCGIIICTLYSVFSSHFFPFFRIMSISSSISLSVISPESTRWLMSRDARPENTRFRNFWVCWVLASSWESSGV